MSTTTTTATITTGMGNTLPVQVAPSGQYGFYAPPSSGWEREPVVQVAQRIGATWAPTPARYYASTISRLDPFGGLAIDSGTHWHLPAEDVGYFALYAREVYTAS